jgi:hypothetical protein
MLFIIKELKIISISLNILKAFLLLLLIILIQRKILKLK